MKRTSSQKKKDTGAGQAHQIRGSLDGAKLKIGLVTARFNSEITSKLEAGALRTLKALGVADKNIRVVSVPGAVEITTAAKALLKSVDAVILLGCVIRGETTHYESVCNAAERGGTHLQLETGKPVVFGVITTENFEQALDRVGGHHGHKGEEAAEVAVEMANLLRVLKKK
ncbi:MAG: 6,7-dimethyl-8-ribityllumazine synthase [Bdellovibrionales bacterium]|jgi:6,7-dimethyl-8-ribityllumazine synthase|nr:6,7-dimethyl-8-ribityllumazine synthase [Bdellovibrionales bacterium]